MHPELEQRFDALQDRRKALIARVRALPPEQQKAKPGKGFSPAEVIMHMALAEEGNINFMRKTPPTALKGKKPKVTFIFRKTVQAMENPAKPIATVGYMIPKGTVDLDEAEKKWTGLRSEMKSFLEQVENPSDPMCKFLFFFGLASADDYLKLMESHHTYHEQRFPTP
jgi:uncharacterized damage-inducible protein DinB